MKIINRSHEATELIHFPYPLREKVEFSNGKSLRLYKAYPTGNVVFKEILGRQAFMFDSMDRLLWQIDPEKGQFDLTKALFDTKVDCEFDFLLLTAVGKDFHIMRVNGDTFELDMETGKAKFIYWQRN
jgi:hypothetical protein